MATRQMKLPQGWYPKEKGNIEKDIAKFLNGFNKPEGIKPFTGCIIPHAGWFFSGQLAARTLSLLKKDADVVVLFGGHMGEQKPRIYLDEGFNTPLGVIESDMPFLEGLSYLCDKESPYSADNTIEVQLPFIKHFFPNAKIAAFRSPPTDDAITLGRECLKKAKELKRKAVYIGSLDLTHYGPRYGFAPKGTGGPSYDWVVNQNDKTIIDYMLGANAEEAVSHSLKSYSSCSAGAASSVISACLLSCKSISSHLVGYYTSRDIMPDDNFVGYAGIGFYDSSS